MFELGTMAGTDTRPDGTIVDGHHRIKILRDRGIDVNARPREIVETEAIDNPLPGDRP